MIVSLISLGLVPGHKPMLACKTTMLHALASHMLLEKFDVVSKAYHGTTYICITHTGIHQLL